MKSLILFIAILFSGMLMQAQMKKATKIIIHTTEITKDIALNDFMDYCLEHDIFFMEVNDGRGIAKSERFSTFGFGNWETLSQITVIAKETETGVNLIISGKTLNGTSSTAPDVRMINKSGLLGNVGKVMFQQVNDIAEQYENKNLLTYSK